MFKKYKENRIVNINLNIIIASIFATLLSAYPVYLTNMFTNSEIVIAGIAFFIDATIDFFIFAILHLRVHKHHMLKFRPSKKIVRDLLKIQIHRGVLSSLYFIIAFGGHFFLLTRGFERTASFLLTYILAIIVTRNLHTIYGKKTGLFEKI